MMKSRRLDTYGRAKSRCDPGHARYVDPQDAQPGADARVRNWAPDRADLAWGFQSESGIAPHRTAAAGAARLARCGVAAHRELTSRQNLPADAGGAQTARG